MLEVRRFSVNSSSVLYKTTFRGRSVRNVLKFVPMTRDVSRPAARAASPTFSPLYRQIKDFLIRSLEQGEWGPGDAIPSEGDLASRFNVSQGTVRKAIDEMAAENLLVRRQGKGTFVATHSDPRSFYRVLRLALLVADLFNSLTLEALRGGERSLYSLFETDFGVRMINAEEHLRAVAADAQSAEVLGVGQGGPLLLVERTAYTYGNKPVEWRLGLYCTHQHYYRNDLG